MKKLTNLDIDGKFSIKQRLYDMFDFCYHDLIDIKTTEDLNPNNVSTEYKNFLNHYVDYFCNELLYKTNSIAAGGFVLSSYTGNDENDRNGKMVYDPEIDKFPSKCPPKRNEIENMWIKHPQCRSNKYPDIDIYVNQSNFEKFLEKLLQIPFITFGSINKKEFNLATSYDKSFFKKNNILFRFEVFITLHSGGIDENNRFKNIHFNSMAKQKFDIMVVSDKTNNIDVVQNFDLTFCEIYFNGKEIYANDDNNTDIQKKTGIIRDEYLSSLFLDKNKFIISRIFKYMERGYIITNLKDHHKISNLYKHPIDDKELKHFTDIFTSTIEKKDLNYHINKIKYVNKDWKSQYNILNKTSNDEKKEMTNESFIKFFLSGILAPLFKNHKKNKNTLYAKETQTNRQDEARQIAYQNQGPSFDNRIHQYQKNHKNL